MLKLATTTCESGRMDESKASLKSYFNILKELGKKPPPDVLQLADKLELSLDSSINNTEAPKNNLSKTEVDQTSYREGRAVRQLAHQGEMTEFYEIFFGKKGQAFDFIWVRIVWVGASTGCHYDWVYMGIDLGRTPFLLL